MEVKLRNSLIMLIDDEDYIKFCHGKKVYATKSRNSFYTYVFWDGKKTSLHRLIMNAPKNLEVDHINRNGLDNRKSNLRLCTRMQNRHNSLVKDKTYRCIYYDKKKYKWRLKIRVNKKSYSFGYFKNLEEAIKKYNEVAKDFYGEFTVYCK